MARRNCESYVSRAIWHGEVGCSGKREHENTGKTGSWPVCCLRAEKVHGGERWKLIATRERSHDAHTREGKKSNMEAQKVRVTHMQSSK